MAIFGSKIFPFVRDEIESRRLELSNPTSTKLGFLSRTPFVVLESNAVKDGSYELAKNNILYGGSEKFIKENISGIYFSKITTEKFKSDSVGLRPPPGITSISVNHEGTLGSVRKAVVNFSCWTTEELEKFQVLYMNPGIQLFLQWGFTRKDRDISIKSIFTENDDIEYYKNTENVQKLTKQSQGNYDALVGVCSTFTWKLNSNGGFDCTTTITSPASFFYDFSFNSPELSKNTFYLWVNGIAEVIKKSTETTETQKQRPQSQEEKNRIDLLKINEKIFNEQLKGINTLKMYALRSKNNNTEFFFNNDGSQYYKFLFLPSSVEDSGLPYEDRSYISLGHLFKLINNLFLYPHETSRNFTDTLKKISETGTGFSKKDFYENCDLFIDLNTKVRNHELLRSFNPAKVLILNSSAERMAKKVTIEDGEVVSSQTPTLFSLLLRGNKRPSTTEKNTIAKDVQDIGKYIEIPKYDKNILEFNYSDTEVSGYSNFDKTVSEFTFGNPKRIFINIDSVIEILNSKSRLYEFIDGILDLINTSVGNVFNLIRDADPDDPKRIKIIDSTLLSSDKDIYEFEDVYKRKTIIRNITLDGNLPSSFQTAAYVSNTNANPAQRDIRQQAAFSAVSNGYVDKSFKQDKNNETFYTIKRIISQTGKNAETVEIVIPRDDADAVTEVIKLPLHEISVIVYQKQFVNWLKYYTLNNSVDFLGFPIGINMHIELDGISGIYYGNLFAITEYVPSFLKQNVCFQITNVAQEVNVEGWTTKLTGVLRPINNTSFRFVLNKEPNTTTATSEPIISDDPSQDRLLVKDGSKSRDETENIANIYNTRPGSIKWE